MIAPPQPTLLPRTVCEMPLPLTLMLPRVTDVPAQLPTGVHVATFRKSMPLPPNPEIVPPFGETPGSLPSTVKLPVRVWMRTPRFALPARPVVVMLRKL